jgi:hypothetical protein
MAKENEDLKQHVTELENRLRALWDKYDGDRKHYMDRIKRLEEAGEAYRTAYTPDGHVAPHDCFATGPKTGNPIEDLVACPGCWAERKAKEAKL